jgi:hypothetical protein
LKLDFEIKGGEAENGPLACGEVHSLCQMGTFQAILAAPFLIEKKNWVENSSIRE